MIYGIGNDIIEIVRIEQMNLAKLILRILTEREQSHLPKHPKRQIEFIAGRFAAKEAIAKALGTGIGTSFSFHDVEVIPDTKGKPEVQIGVDLQKRLDEQIRFHLSISHTDQYAMATCVIEQFA